MKETGETSGVPALRFEFSYDGKVFDVLASNKIEAFEKANQRVRADGVNDAFAWFDAHAPEGFEAGFYLCHSVSMD